MSTIQVTTTLTTIHCYKCGIFFAVPAYFDARREEDGRGFWCPNGHAQQYKKEPEKSVPEKPELAPLAQRQELILAIHRAEQAEAKAAEAKAGAQPATDAPQTDAPPPAPQPTPELSESERLGHLPDLPAVKVAEQRMICPHCQKGYRIGTCFASHLRRDHADTATADRVKKYLFRKAA